MATVAITGASGFVGSELSRALEARGDRVRPLVRPGHSAEHAIAWDPEAGSVDANALAEVDVLVHLAGENLSSGRWTEARKARIRESRVRSTALLARTLAASSRRPKVWVSASAVGYYGDRGSTPVDESTGPGDDFLAELCQAWERAAQAAIDAGVRVVFTRLGVVLHPSGGALAKMLLPFKLGLGGRFGSGQQGMSWVTREDVVRALLHAIDHPELAGPLNVTAPEPVSNAEFTRALAHALKRPAIFPIPAFAARLAIGEMAQAALLSGAYVQPKRLLASGFRFAHPTLAPYLEQALA